MWHEQILIPVLAAFLAQIVIFLKWAYRHARDAQIQSAFVRDMATTHLPHIYAALEQIADALAITIEEPPAIAWLNRKKLDGE